MKKIIAILFIAVVFTACTQDFKKDIEPRKFDGVKIEIDSSQWTPALIQVDEHIITVYESGEIRQVRLFNVVGVYICGVLVGLIIGVVLAINVKDKP